MATKNPCPHTMFRLVLLNGTVHCRCETCGHRWRERGTSKARRVRTRTA